MILSSIIYLAWYGHQVPNIYFLLKNPEKNLRNRDSYLVSILSMLKAHILSDPGGLSGSFLQQGIKRYHQWFSDNNIKEGTDLRSLFIKIIYIKIKIGNLSIQHSDWTKRLAVKF